MKIYWLEQTDADLPAGGTGFVPEGGDGGRVGRAMRLEWMGTPATAILPTAGPGEDGGEMPHIQNGGGATPELEWLSVRELAQFSAMRFAKRRADWRLGRWTAKHAVATCLCLPADIRSLAEIEVRPRQSGAPEVFLRNKWAPVSISLSHRAGRAVCAVAAARCTLGCDLEVVESHSDAFIADYLAPEEQALVALVAPEHRPWLVTLLWSAKESALKALGAGLRIDTRRVIVTLVHTLRGPEEPAEDSSARDYGDNANLGIRLPDVDGWRPLRVQHANDQTFRGWWQRTGNLLRTIVAAPPPARPLFLNGLRSPASDHAELREHEFQLA
jgi:4'-phosphopantetheinyl transferase